MAGAELKADYYQTDSFMKTEAVSSMNVMLVAFCLILIGFVVLNCRMSKTLSQNQAQTEQRIELR